ncbi:hypothetical protein MUP01_13795, partial [Candidatus Bathyarchaeota archaeon]|nr:hypothetical protein [Candidatus Bathyarchaeota archaeon]
FRIAVEVVKNMDSPGADGQDETFFEKDNEGVDRNVEALNTNDREEQTHLGVTVLVAALEAPSLCHSCQELLDHLLGKAEFGRYVYGVSRKVVHLTVDPRERGLLE